MTPWAVKAALWVLIPALPISLFALALCMTFMDLEEERKTQDVEPEVWNFERVVGPPAMRVYCPCRAIPVKPFEVMVFVRTYDPAQTVTLDLPAGLYFTSGETAEKKVPPPNAQGYSSVTWRIWAARTGGFLLKATGTGLPRAEESLNVSDPNSCRVGS